MVFIVLTKVVDGCLNISLELLSSPENAFTIKMIDYSVLCPTPVCFPRWFLRVEIESSMLN